MKPTFPRKKTTLLLLSGLVGGLAIVAAVGPWLIEVAYRGDAPRVVDGLITPRGRVPLQAYLDRWYQLSGATLLVFFVVGIVCYLGVRVPERRRRLVRAAVGGAETLGPSEALWWGALLGLLGGASEGAYHALRQLVTQRPAAGMFWELLWMAPLSSMLAAAAVAGALQLVARLGSTRVGIHRLTLLLGFGVAYGLLRSEGIRLYPWAGALLSLGSASVVARAAAARSGAVHRHAPTARALVLGCTAALVAAGLLFSPGVREWRALRARAPAAQGLPNVLVIILDTVRAANLGLYGYDRPTTPELERWAQDGVVFDRAYATAPWTLPSHASIFTGRYAGETNTGIFSPLDDSDRVLAEAFRAQSYATAGFVANLVYATEMSGLERGFDRYEARPLTFGQFLVSSFLSEFATGLLRRWSAWFGPRPKTAEDVTGEFLEWVQDREGRPFFAFLNFFDAHEPYLAPQRFRRRFDAPALGPWDDFESTWPEVRYGPAAAGELGGWVRHYDAAIAYMDEQLGVIRRALEALGLRENTLVVITSDHGEMWGENGQIGHAYSLYEPVLRVPLLLSFPGRTPEGVRDGTDVTLRDLAATVTDLVGTDGYDPFPGHSLAALWDDGDDGRVSPVISEVETSAAAPDWTPAWDGPMESLVQGRMHLILRGDGGRELYDLARDPHERTNLASRPVGPEVARLEAVLGSR